MVRKLDPELTPVRRLIIMPPPDLPAEQLESELDRAESQAEEVYRENDQRFEKAMKIIRKCAFRRGFRNALLGGKLGDHYEWCPYPHWDRSDSVSFLWPKTKEDFEELKRREAEGLTDPLSRNFPKIG